MHMDQVTDWLPSIIAIHNGICVYGQTPKEHDHNLIQLMKTTAPSAESDNLRSASTVWSSPPKA